MARRSTPLQRRHKVNFPHMNEGRFPGTPHDVYQYQNEFAYSRWPKNVKINVLNVKWNSDYKDVPAFQSTQARDAWLDAHASLEDSFILPTMMRNVFDGYVSLPIPYAVMSRYNYVFVDLPMATSASEPIANESASGVRRYCYFVEDIQQAAPSTTKCRVTLDAWTTYINDLQVPYMQLERGHAPMAAAASVSDYLRDPLSHTSHLLADDVSFDDATIAKHSHLIDFGGSEKWVLFATTAAPADLASLVDAPTGSATPATFYDVDQRDGYQLGVSGYDWEFGRDYSTQRAPARPWQNEGGSVPNGYSVYCVKATEAPLFFEDVAVRCPAFLSTIGGCFVLGAALFGRGTARSILGHTVYDVIEQTASVDVDLAKSDFGYPTEYDALTKLYTYPYAHLEASDNFGNSFEMRVESTSGLGVRCPVSLAFPYLYMQPFLVGANGTGRTTYTWTQLDGTTTTEDAYTSDISRFMWTWEIPTYVVMQEGARDWAAHNAATLDADRQAALNAYRSGVRGANTGYENTSDSNNTSVANTARSGQTSTQNTARSGQTSVDNTARSGQTSVDNTARSGQTSVDNTARSGDTSVENTQRSGELAQRTTDNNNNCSRDNQSSSNSLLERRAELGVARVWAESGNAQSVMAKGLQADATAASNSLAVSMGTSAASAVVGAASAGAVSGEGLANFGLGQVQTAAQIGIALGKEAEMVSAQSEATHNNAQSNNDITGLEVTAQTTRATEINERQIGNATQITNDQVDTNNANADASRSTANTNANASRNTSNANAGATAATANQNATASADTANANASASADTANANASASASTANANASASANTSNANASYSRDVAVDTAKRALNLAQQRAQATHTAAGAGAPVEYGARAGEPMPDVMRRRQIQIRVCTQRPDAIAQAGDYFLRYGYASNRNWSVSDFCPMPHFCYWKAADATVVDGLGATNAVSLAIQDILEAGVTAWRDPDEIGRISIYGNR